MKAIAIIQSNYIPWKGYFDIINSVDEFIIYDECQYTRRDWRNRNRIKTHKGYAWLTIPVNSKGKRSFPICRIQTDAQRGRWRDTHLSTLQRCYARAPAFKNVWPEVERMYSLCGEETFLSRINFILIRELCGLLKITTPLLFSMDVGAPMSDPTDRLIDICLRRGADTYLSGPTARAYLDESRFASKGINVIWMTYNHYPEYPQVYPPFEHGVTVLDVLFNVGQPRARDYVCLFGTQLRKDLNSMKQEQNLNGVFEQ